MVSIVAVRSAAAASTSAAVVAAVMAEIDAEPLCENKTDFRVVFRLGFFFLLARFLACPPPCAQFCGFALDRVATRSVLAHVGATRKRDPNGMADASFRRVRVALRWIHAC